MAMKFNAKAISPKKVQKDAEDLFRGGFFCCEALISAVRSNFELDCSEELIAVASGMAVGVGRSGCICGALNGGVMALGCFFGRTKQGDPKVQKTMELTSELHDWFKKANGKNATCCRILTKGMDMASGEHKEQCIHFTGLAAWKVADIVVREFGLENLDKE